MELIKKEAAIALIEQKQKQLCPVGKFSRNAVYGTDRDRFDAWDEIIDQITALPTIDPVLEAGGCYCRECRRCNGFPGPEIEQNEVGICKLTGFAVEPDGWCKWGKLREAQDDEIQI